MAAALLDFVKRIHEIRIVRFAIIGGLSSAIYAIVVWPLLFFDVTTTVVASVVGYLAAIPFNFVGQRNYTFRSNGRITRELVMFVLVQGLNIAMSAAVLHLAVDVLQWPAIVGILMVIVAVPISTYVMMRVFVFIGAAST